MSDDLQTVPHSSHWGAFDVTVRDGDIASVQPLHDPDPSPLLGNLPGSLRHPVRIERPVARRGWLERGPGPSRDRGNDSFVELSWDEALDRAADELEARASAQHGNRADLRRLVRLGERRHVPSEPEPAASLPESDRRLHRRIATATASARRWCCCRTWSEARPRCSARPRRGMSSRGTPSCWSRSAVCR